MIQSQVVPTTATTENQVDANSPPVPRLRGTTTSEGGRLLVEVPSSATGSHAVEGSSAKNRTGGTQSCNAFGHLIRSVEEILLQHAGHYMTLHDIPINMDNLGDFSHRYTANTFHLLRVVTPNRLSQRRVSIGRVLVLADQGYESITLNYDTRIVLFVRLQERHSGHWVLISADLRKQTLTYHDSTSSTVGTNDTWFTRTCSEVQDMLRKYVTVRHPHLKPMNFPFTFVHAKVSLVRLTNSFPPLPQASYC